MIKGMTSIEELRSAIDPVNDVKINKYRLDDEARSLPSISQRYYEIVYSYLIPEVEELRFQLEKEVAVARSDIRRGCSARGEKITKDEMEAEVMTLPAVMDLRRRIRALDSEISYYKGILNALDCKRSSLNNLVQLYTKEYYGSMADDGRYRQADVAYSRTEGNDYDRRTEEQSQRISKAIKARRNRNEEL